MTHQTIPADEALRRLKEGNNHCMVGRLQNEGADLALMKKLAEEGQDPWVIILTCIDSRVVVERIFDLKTGDAFTPETIGNTADVTEDWAVWYAVHACNIRLVVVLGHESCGAVQHAIKGERLGQCIDGVIDAIQPAIDAASTEGDHYKNVIVENAKLVAARFRKHPDLKELVDSGELRVLPAYYHIDTCQVDFLE